MEAFLKNSDKCNSKMQNLMFNIVVLHRVCKLIILVLLQLMCRSHHHIRYPIHTTPNIHPHHHISALHPQWISKRRQRKKTDHHPPILLQDHVKMKMTLHSSTRVSVALAFGNGSKSAGLGSLHQSSTHGFPSFSIRLPSSRAVELVRGLGEFLSKVFLICRETHHLNKLRNYFT